MRKITGLGIVLLFIMTGTVSAQMAKATLEGKVTVADFDYECFDATVETDSPYFKTVKTDPQGMYKWAGQLIPADTKTDIGGTITARWEFNIFGVVFNLKGTKSFIFINPIPFASYTQRKNIEVSFDHVSY